ncbi:malonate decarboxylase subunit epsilon [Pantoea sp. 1.19]|uniref:malonate decarboxylase subunit epsilon n=1 Tax=Pantoea sp. 1.19 TaxID=1925589 RepID=UPI000949098A|nr:malonate decarboxylase subunit epsilon [Pantoea sp. 1.19]
MKSLLTFPGQGAQQPGMLHQLPPGDDARRLLAQASAVLRQDALTLDSAAALADTRAVQLCLLIAGVAWARALEAAGGRFDAVAGLSIGAWPAAVVAGALAFDDAVWLVARRGELMAAACPDGYGMAVIIGLSPSQVTRMLAAERSVDQPLWLANINAEDQLVIAGSGAAMNRVMARARAAGARKTHRLKVSVPSHCPLLADAAAQLAAAMAGVTLRRPTRAWLSGSCARVRWEPAAIADDLAYNMARQVRWHDTMVAACERGVRLMVEMPPGQTLTALARGVIGEGEAVALAGRGLSDCVALLNRYAGDGR